MTISKQNENSKEGHGSAKQIEVTLICQCWKRVILELIGNQQTSPPLSDKRPEVVFLLSRFPVILGLLCLSLVPFSKFNALIYSEWCQKKPIGHSIWGCHVQWLHNFYCKVSLEFLVDCPSLWAVAIVHRARGQNQEKCFCPYSSSDKYWFENIIHI